MSPLKRPLSELFRPKKLAHFIGQKHLVGDEGPIKKSLNNNAIYSMIFWGPPGCGKTTLARVISHELDADFIEMSPTTAGVKDIKNVVAAAKKDFFGEKRRTILFVDEIHRFNKAQQDYLLPHVEAGTIILIGATTENPSFEVITPLLSRSRVYVLEPLSRDDMAILLNKALKLLKLSVVNLKVTKEGRELLLDLSNGDARFVLNALDSLVATGAKSAKKEDILRVLQQNPNRYDKGGEEHYDTVSAFIKSMRAGDADAALYYLARMVYGGEDPKFIARRLVIFASEDVGLADPQALQVANDVFRACETIGYPECQINLAHGTVFLARAPKSRKSYDAFFKALKDVERYGNLPIPLHLRNAPTKLMKDLGYGKGYKMYPKKGKSFLPDELEGKNYLN